LSNLIVLDSYAILAFLRKEAGHERVFEILKGAKDGKLQVMMTWVNVGEVAYIVQRSWDKSHVHEILANLESSKVDFVDAGEKLSLKAADLKAEYPMAYADAFAAALTELQDAVLVTGDPEFKPLEDILAIEWL